MYVRELPDGPIGVEEWPASRLMLQWLMTSNTAPSLKGVAVLELGSGCGALAMNMVTKAGALKVFASEGEQEVLDNLRFNVTASGMDSQVFPCLWDWETSIRPPTELDLSEVSIIIASDVVYVGTAECHLSHALAGLCRPASKGLKGREAWLMLADRPVGGEDFVTPAMPDDGVDQHFGADGQRLSAVGRFVHACGRRGLELERTELDPKLIEEESSRFVNGRQAFEGHISMYRVYSVLSADLETRA